MENNTTKLKILQIITQGEWGGAQRYVFDLTNHFTSDFLVTVAIGEKDGRNDLQKRLNTPNVQLKHLKRSISPIQDILAVWELKKLYKTLKPDVIHLNSSKAGIIGSLAGIGYKGSVIYTVHGWVFNEPTRKLGRIIYRFLEKTTAKLKNKIIVLSDRDLNDGIKLGIAEKKLVKTPLGITPPTFLNKEEARKFLNLNLREEDTVNGTIANLYPSKGLDTLIEAVRIINNHKFIIIGEGPERKNLENLIKKYNLENKVFLTGALDSASQYLKAFDLFVLPSRKEGLPYTLLEAMTADLPIVATNVGGIAELIPDTIPPDNPKILAEKIIAKLNNPTSSQKNIPSLEEMLQQTKNIYFTS